MVVSKTSPISPLDPTASEPFYRQVYDRFRGAIASGVLKPGDRIPSVRALTKELGLARGTIDAAYSLLAAEGYIQARAQAGTVVTPGLKLPTPVAGVTHQSDYAQAIVTAFITEGHFARHIQRMRKLYAERREATAVGLESVLGKHMRIDAQPGGMHLILRPQRQRSDSRLVARMRAEGLYGEAMSNWTMGPGAASALLLGFTNIESQSTAEKLGRRILKLI